jgi:hypothetical protein
MTRNSSRQPSNRRRTAKDASKWRLFNKTVSEVRAACADVPRDELQKMIDEAVREARRERHSKRKAR